MIHNPEHPGAILREDVLEPLGLSVTEAAERLGVARSTLSRVINQRAGISPDFAVRLETAGVSNARVWLSPQMQYDHWQAMQHRHPEVRPLDMTS